MEIKIDIEGKEYGCALTMGAALRFKELTGKELGEIKPENTTEIVSLLFCSVQSWARRHGEPFDFELYDFADRLDLTQVQQWFITITEDAAAEKDTTGGKKKPRR